MNIAKIWWIKTRCAVLTVQTKANKYVDLANRKAELFPLQSVSNFSILVLLRIITISCFSILVICYFQVSFNLNEISYVVEKPKNWVPFKTFKWHWTGDANPSEWRLSDACGRGIFALVLHASTTRIRCLV